MTPTLPVSIGLALLIVAAFGGAWLWPRTRAAIEEGGDAA